MNADFRETVVQQIMHQDPFYARYVNVLGADDADDVKINPNKVFAFGFGDSEVHESIGKFRALEVTEFDECDDSAEEYEDAEDGVEELPIVKCDSVPEYKEMFKKLSPENLYCL